MNDLIGKVALVTGGSRGIGRATALALAEQGAQVIVHYGTRVEDANAVVAAIRTAGGKADIAGADLALADGAAQLAGQVKALSATGLDILVANAGISGFAPIGEQTVEKFDALFAVNVRAPYFLVQQLLPLFRDDASVVLLSSLVARSAIDGLSAYAATKGAIDTLVKHFAAALGQRGIRVNAVAPGVIDTDMSSFARTAEGRAFVFGLQALKRLGQPEDIADVVAFLASPKARWITGNTICVDGGSKL